MSKEILEELAAYRPGSVLKGGGRKHNRLLTVNAPAGVFVHESDAGQCALPTAAAHVTGGKGGVLPYNPARQVNSNGLEYEAGEMVGYCKKGPIVVITEEAVSDGEQVYVRHTANGSGKTQLGACRNDADGDAAETLVLTVAATSCDEADGGLDYVIDDEVFHSSDDGTAATAIAVAAIVTASIDASAAFAATAVGDGTITVTRADGGSPGSTNLHLPESITSAHAADSDPETCAAWPGARFVGDHTSGAAVVDFFAN